MSLRRIIHMGSTSYVEDPIVPATGKTTRMTDLELMIKNGWGSTPQGRIPKDWRTRKNDPHKKIPSAG